VRIEDAAGASVGCHRHNYVRNELKKSRVHQPNRVRGEVTFDWLSSGDGKTLISLSRSRASSSLRVLVGRGSK